jgi:hypothetical protein
LERICEARAGGETWVGACAVEGVTYEALRQAGKQDPAIGEAMAVADGLGASYWLGRIASPDAAGKDAPGDWRREAWIAERLHREAFPRPTERVESTVDVTASAAALSGHELREQVATWLASDPELVALVVPLLLDEPAARRLIVASLAAVDVLTEGDDDGR